MKILIVDDSSRMRQLIKKMIKTEKNEIFECEDGIYSFADYERIKPDIVLMDINMKKMNGLDASLQILNKYPKARIIILTDYDEHLLREKAKLSGIKYYLLKDNLTMLREVINNYDNRI